MLSWLLPSAAPQHQANVVVPAIGGAAVQADAAWRLFAGGPDWADGQDHCEDFEEVVANPSKGLLPPRVPPLDMQDEHTLELVHVGKTGGSTVRFFLRQNELDFLDFHEKPPVDSAHAEFFDRWVVTVRDPVDRAVSAFNWRHPCGGGGSKLDHASQDERDFEARLYGCFEHVRDFANALEDETDCGAVARESLVSPNLSHHMGKGLHYYIGDTLHLLRNACTAAPPKVARIPCATHGCLHLRSPVPRVSPYSKDPLLGANRVDAGGY